MNRKDLSTIEYILDEIVEERVQRKMKEFYDNIRREYPNLPYDLSKASVGVTKSAFDVLMTTSDNLGQSSRSYVSKFTDPNFLEQGLGLNEPAKFQMTQEDYDNGKKHSDIPVSAFDGLTAPYEDNLDRNFKNKSSYVPSREELSEILKAKPYLFTSATPALDDVTVPWWNGTSADFLKQTSLKPLSELSTDLFSPLITSVCMSFSTTKPNGLSWFLSGRKRTIACWPIEELQTEVSTGTLTLKSTEQQIEHHDKVLASVINLSKG